MANLFKPSINLLPIKVVVFAFLVSILLSVGISYYFTPKYTRVGYIPTQPVPYSHALHVNQLGMDCRYCHSFVEISSHANIPSTQTCMACHLYVQKDSPKLEAVRESWKTGRPIEWVKIHAAPDFVYFDHSVHVNRGVSCVSCHGNVNRMEVVWQDKSMSMGWCLDCHRNPENAVRPLAEVYHLDWVPPKGTTQKQIGKQLVEDWKINPPQSCGGCHR